MPRFMVNDVREFDPRAVSIAHQLGSKRPADYQLIEDWLKQNPQLNGLQVDTLTEVFDREHPEFADQTEKSQQRNAP